MSKRLYSCTVYCTAVKPYAYCSLYSCTAVHTRLYGALQLYIQLLYCGTRNCTAPYGFSVVSAVCRTPWLYLSSSGPYHGPHSHAHTDVQGFQGTVQSANRTHLHVPRPELYIIHTMLSKLHPANHDKIPGRVTVAPRAHIQTCQETHTYTRSSD